MAIILNGKKIAEKIKKQLKKQVGKMRQKPGLAVILIGKNPASITFIRLKEKAAAGIGINFKKFIFPAFAKASAGKPVRVSKNKIIKLIERLNKNKRVHGIIIQLPLPKHLNPDEIVQKIDPKKDIDGFISDSKFISPTHQAILALLKATKYESLTNIQIKRATILTKSKIFAEPLKKILEKKKIRTEVLTTNYKSITNIQITKIADVVIVALGRPNFLKPSMIKRGSVIIDVGYSRVKGRSVGDVHPDCAQKASYLSPVPGGVGPLTVIFLLKNVVLSARQN